MASSFSPVRPPITESYSQQSLSVHIAVDSGQMHFRGGSVSEIRSIDGEFHNHLKISAYNSDFWLVKTKRVYMYLHPPNRK